MYMLFSNKIPIFGAPGVRWV